MFGVWRRAARWRRNGWREIDRRIDLVAASNRRRAPIWRGAARYDARGWLEDNRDCYTYDGHRLHASDGRFMPAICGGAWSPPIGIPDPGWGVETPVMPALPSPWTSNTAGFYYVKPGGSNSGNGFPTSPRGTIPNPVPAGAVVVLDNTVTWTNFGNSGGNGVGVNMAGNSGNPCFIVGASLSTTNRPIINLTIDHFIDGTYGVVEFLDFRITAGVTTSIFFGLNGNGTDHISFRHNEMRGLNAGTKLPEHVALGIYSWAGSFSRSNIIIYDCYEHTINQWDRTDQDLDAHGIKVDAPTSNVWVLDSLFDTICGDSFQFGPQDFDTACHHIYAGRNVTSQTRQSGGWIKGTNHAVISQCTAALTGVPGAGGPGWGFGEQSGGRNLWFLYNHAYSFAGQAGIGFLDAGSATNEPQNMYAIGNVLHDGDTSKGEGLVGLKLRSLNLCWAVNNTIVNQSVGIEKSVNGTQAHELHNNIIDNISSFHYRDNGSAEGVKFRNNLFGLGAQNFRVSYNATTFTSLASFAAAAGAAASGNINADPTYVDGANATIANRNFRLVAGSRGINEGNATEPSPYATFQSLYGLDIRKDPDGVTRPQSTTWDIGAYEFVAGGGPTLIAGADTVAAQAAEPRGWAWPFTRVAPSRLRKEFR